MKTKIFAIIILIFMLNNTALGMPKDFGAAAIPGNIQFQVIDPYGNITGFDPVSGAILTNIPNTMYFFSSDGDFVTNNNSQHTLDTKRVLPTTQITSGIYRIKIFGVNVTENFVFYFNVFYQNIMSAQIMVEHYSAIYPNVTWTYEITIPDVPPAMQNVPLIKVSNPQELIIDINAAAPLNFIGNSKFVTELTKEINEIEAEKAKGKVDDGLTPAQKAKKEYTELLGEITEKYNKPESDEFVKQEAYTVLKEDLEYIINHL